MTIEKNPPERNKHDQGAKVSRAHQEAYAINTERAQARIVARDEAGRALEKLTKEQWDTILSRIAAGEIPAQVIRSFDMSPHALNAKEKRDEEFRSELSKAYATAFFNFMYDARSVARGLEGFSTGSIERDKLVIDTDWRMAKALVPRLVDKQQVDQRSISISLNRDESEW